MLQANQCNDFEIKTVNIMMKFHDCIKYKILTQLRKCTNFDWQLLQIHVRVNVIVINNCSIVDGYMPTLPTVQVNQCQFTMI